MFTPIVLKLTGVITWSWWWVLSPIWISAAVLVLLAAGAVTLGVVLHCRSWVRRPRPPAELWLWPAGDAQSHDASGDGAPF
jgi:Transmembrane Fragile-X-F protein